MDLEERYSSLQEENAAKTRKLKRAVQLLNSAKAELADQQREQQREMEGILDGVRALRRELQLADLVLDAYIPKEYQVSGADQKMKQFTEVTAGNILLEIQSSLTVEVPQPCTRSRTNTVLK